MKEIEKMVKTEYKLARQQCRQDLGGYYKMMIDTDGADIWADIFISVNNWKEYRSESIMQLDAAPGYVHEREPDYIADAIRKLKAAGWEIEEDAS